MKSGYWWLISGLLWLGLSNFLVACQPTKSDEPQPPEILYGQEVCEMCGMLIDDPRFAAATLLVDGQARKFDDAGEMVLYHMEHPDQMVSAWFVHDHKTEVWTRGETAFYVINNNIHSPMGHGVAAFVAEADAVALATELAAVVTDFDGLRAAIHVSAHGN